MISLLPPSDTKLVSHPLYHKDEADRALLSAALMRWANALSAPAFPRRAGEAECDLLYYKPAGLTPYLTDRMAPRNGNECPACSFGNACDCGDDGLPPDAA